MGMSFNFILQATRVLHIGNYKEDELKLIYDYIVSIDNDILSEYNSTCTILSYNNDLELYIEIINELISIYESKEEYENCQILKNKKEEAIKILESKTI
jgi:hypothetical protein